MFASCVPSHCGRFASDNVISENELIKLKDLTTSIFHKFFDHDDETSVTFDLHSEALSQQNELLNSIDEILKVRIIYKLVDNDFQWNYFSRYNRN